MRSLKEIEELKNKLHEENFKKTNPKKQTEAKASKKAKAKNKED